MWQAMIGAANAAGRLGRRLGLEPARLDADSLIAEARRQTGLDDFDGEEFREPLGILIRGYDSEARLSPIGRVVVRRDTVNLLASRLRLVADRRRHPSIAAQEIARPVFIVGLPRTGSTLLHHLLAQDPASRAALAWEVMAPSPPPESSTRDTDPRIARAERQLRWLDRLAPEFKTIHPLGARLALECIAIMSPTFLSPRFHTTYHVPTYQEWLERQDLRPAYEFHRRVLQHLGWRVPAARWVLKAPAHLHAFDALFDTYPDAVVVQTHRDPLAVIPSAASLTAVLQRAFAEWVDPVEIGQEVTRRWANGLERAIQFRHSGRVSAERFLDVNYADLRRDPLRVIRRVYHHFDLPLAPAALERMRAHLAEHPQGKNGAHVYTLERFGLDAQDLSHRFKGYRECFGIVPEDPQVHPRGRPV